MCTVAGSREMKSSSLGELSFSQGVCFRLSSLLQHVPASSFSSGRCCMLLRPTSEFHSSSQSGRGGSYVWISVFFFFFCKPIMVSEALHVLLTEATPQTAAVFTLVGPEKERLITVPWRLQRQAWPFSAYGQGWISKRLRSSRCMESFFFLHSLLSRNY